MAKSTENFFETILSNCYWNHVLICGSSRTVILHTKRHQSY